MLELLGHILKCRLQRPNQDWLKLDLETCIVHMTQAIVKTLRFDQTAVSDSSKAPQYPTIASMTLIWMNK